MAEIGIALKVIVNVDLRELADANPEHSIEATVARDLARLLDWQAKAFMPYLKDRCYPGTTERTLPAFQIDVVR